jgi:hypothetical protein
MRSLHLLLNNDHNTLAPLRIMLLYAYGKPQQPLLQLHSVYWYVPLADASDPHKL